MPHAERQVRRFGRFTLEPDAGTLSRDGTVIPLRPKSFAVLWHLSDHAGRVVSKEELLAKEWPSVIVGEDSLVQCIGEIRVALEDRDRRLIQTIAGRGYRLHAQVETVGLSDTLTVADSSEKGFADELALGRCFSNKEQSGCAWRDLAIDALDRNRRRDGDDRSGPVDRAQAPTPAPMWTPLAGSPSRSCRCAT